MKPGLRLAVSLCSMRAMSRRHFLLAPAVLLAGCIHVKVDMDPIHVHATVDVNVKIDQALDDFFGDLDRRSTTIQAEPKTK
ncbi:MAG: hypothetical protein RLZZ129_1352 [Verrucomicrobiota bacterium]|jgi:hypothetical protein